MSATSLSVRTVTLSDVSASVMIGVLPIGRLPGEDRDLAAFFWSLRADRYEAWRAAGVDANCLDGEVAMVTAGIRHHVKEEETELFPQLKKKLNRDELAELGDAVMAAKKNGSRVRA